MTSTWPANRRSKWGPPWSWIGATRPVPGRAVSPRAGRNRLLGLDALRGIAVVLMIEQHLGVWLWRGPRSGESVRLQLGFLLFNALGGAAAPLFVTLAGIGAILLANSRAEARARAWPEERGRNPDRTLVTRGLVVMGFGYALSFLTPSWFSWQTWFVLHMIGLGIVATPVLRRLPTWALVGLALGVLAATAWVQATLDVPLHLHNEYMRGRGPHPPRQWTALRIAVAEGQFPVFPWLSFYLVGLACGRWVGQGRLDRIVALGRGIAMVGGLGLLLRPIAHGPGTGLLQRATAVNVPFFPTSPTLAALLLAGVLLAISLALAWEQHWPLRESNPLVTLGRASLTLLILHVWLFREATRPIGMWHALDIGPAMAVLVAFVLLAGSGAWLWQRIDYRYGAEWLLRKLAA
jgi:uncharacterized membrane protein